MISFSEKRLPLDLSLAAVGGAEYSTNVVTTISGHEQRNINWCNARSRYELTPALQDSEQLEKLITFFRAHKGKAIGFRFRDWSDYSAIDELIGEGDGQTQSFQLSKTYILKAVQESAKNQMAGTRRDIHKEVEVGEVYQIDAIIDKRIITKPVAETLKVYVDGVEEIGHICDYTSGKVTLSLAPPIGAKVTASFEFDVPVRFDTDFLELSPESNAGIKIPIIEIKVQI